jgi:hypothetical protein
VEEHEEISEWQTAKITKPEIRTEIMLACVITWMHSVCNKARVKCQQLVISITVTLENRRPERPSKLVLKNLGEIMCFIEWSSIFFPLSSVYTVFLLPPLTGNISSEI